MADLSRRSRVGVTSLLVALAVGIGAGRAEAQFANGFGLNGGAYPFYTPGFGPSQETRYLFDRSESLSAHYENLLRDHYRHNAANPRDFKQFSRENPGRSTRNNRPRRPAESSPSEPPPDSSSTAPPQSSTVPAIELGSFLGSDGHVDWPRDVPGSPDLDAKRNAADEAIRAAAGQIKDGKVTVEAVNLAREKLIAFGQPSLAKVRAERSARVAESFHSYLRQLLRAVEDSAAAGEDEHRAAVSLPVAG